MRTAITLVTAMLVATPAAADKAITKELDTHLGRIMTGAEPELGPGPVFAFTGDAAYEAPATLDDARGTLPDYTNSKNVVVVVGADRSTAWIAADLSQHTICGMQECQNDPPDGWYHATALYELKPALRPIAWHIADVVTGKAQAKAIKKGAKPPPISRKVEPAAADVVKLFESTIGDPAKLAKTIAEHPRALLYGSDLKERVVGAKRIRAKLAAWKLALKVRDGIQAGTSKNKQTAWVAANVDATSLKKKGAAAVPYRVLAIYARYTTGWAIEALHFSYVP